MEEESLTLIKKYPNRRLYDTGASRYVNLEDVALMIREEKGIKVVDSASGSDITKDVMLQIITESPYGKEFIPVELLRNLITLGGETLREMMKRVVEDQSELASKMQKFMWTGIETNPLMGMWLRMAREYQAKDSAQAEAKLKQKEREIESLKAEINALQQALQKEAPEKQDRKKPRK
jgi:polyhydroxyalkanoate synthesis repressor PhaR